MPSGKVLVTGGVTCDSQGLHCGRTNTVELYDPVAGTWTATGSLITARYGHTATLLQNGKVLVAGGYDSDNINTAELYDPADGHLDPDRLPYHGQVRTHGHAAPGRERADRRGTNDDDLATTDDTELYRPGHGQLERGFHHRGRIWHTATLLPDGRVLVAGGNGCCGGFLAR